MARLRSGIWTLLTVTALAAALQARDLPRQNAPGLPAGQANTQTTGTGLLMGTIVDSLTDRPVAASLVTLNGRSGGSVALALTDAQGRFVFGDLPKNVYTISAWKAGYSEGAYGRRRPSGSAQTLTLADAERIGDLKIPIWKDGSITGTIRDEAGEPMVDVSVRVLVRTLVAGKRKLSPGSVVRTDDRGFYRVGALTPGDYVVVVPSTQTTAPESVVDLYRQTQTGSDAMREFSANGAGSMLNFIVRSGGVKVGNLTFQSSTSTSRAGIAPSPSADGHIFVYPTQYYPAATSAAQATAITLQSGEERSGVDLQLALAPTSRVSGTVTGPEGPLTVALSLSPNADDLATDTNLETATTVSDAAGQFTFLGVPAGRYLLRVVKSPPAPARGAAAAPVSGGPTWWATQPISVDSSDLDDVAVTLRTGYRLTGLVAFDDAAKPPAPNMVQRITATVESADGRPFASVTMGRGQFDADGRFSSSQLPTGRYCLRINSPPPGWTLKSAILDGRDISDVPLSLDRDLSGVVITFTNQPGELSGRVQSASGVADAAATVLVFPAESASWIDYGANPQRLRSIRADEDGAYRAVGLPDGDYLVVAIADDAASNWQDPSTLQTLARLATAVTLAAGERRSLELKTVAVPR